MLNFQRKLSGGAFDSSPFARHYSKRALNRLNARYQHIIEPNRAHIDGKRVIDLAAHDGRFTWAALNAGAAFVEAVEWRSELVAGARTYLDQFTARYSLLQGDVFQFLEASTAPVDTIMCLGLFYHINEHFRLLRLMADKKPSAIILDTALLTTDRLQIDYGIEETDNILNTVPGDENKSSDLTGSMSRGLLAKWCELSGYKLDYVPWRKSEIASPEEVRDYLDIEKRNRARFTCVMTKASS